MLRTLHAWLTGHAIPLASLPPERLDVVLQVPTHQANAFRKAGKAIDWLHPNNVALLRELDRLADNG